MQPPIKLTRHLQVLLVCRFYLVAGYVVHCGIGRDCTSYSPWIHRGNWFGRLGLEAGLLDSFTHHNRSETPIDLHANPMLGRLLASSKPVPLNLLLFITNSPVVEVRSYKSIHFQEPRGRRSSKDSVALRHAAEEGLRLPQPFSFTGNTVGALYPVHLWKGEILRRQTSSHW